MDVNAIYRGLSEGYSRELRENLMSSGKQLSTWLVLGNAAALAFTVSASINPSLPPAIPIRWIYALFLLGLGSSFASLVVTTAALAKVVKDVAELHTRLINNHHREFLADEMEKEGVRPPSDWEQQDKLDSQAFADAATMGDRLHKKLAPARWLVVVSMLALAAGLSCPLFYIGS